MNAEILDLSTNKESTEDQAESVVDSVLKDAVDPRDLVTKRGDMGSAEELLTNPAVTPQMLDDRRDLRDDLKRD